MKFKRKLIPLILALVLTLSLPALAAGTTVGAHSGTYGLTISNVVDAAYFDREQPGNPAQFLTGLETSEHYGKWGYIESTLYTVEAPATIRPNGEAYFYVLGAGGRYVPLTNRIPNPHNGFDWACDAGSFTTLSQPGYYLVHYTALAAGDPGPGNEGSYTLLHVVNANEAAAFGGSPISELDRLDAGLDGKRLSLKAYLIYQNSGLGDGSNYVQLRDLAEKLSGTAAQFDVSWDQESATISVATRQPYTPQENASNWRLSAATARPSQSKLLVDGADVALEGYTIDGNTYYKLRDLGGILGFNVKWTAEDGVSIEPGVPYTDAD